MLIERGVGELQHPTYGTIKVVPTGDIEREDDPVNRLGESTVTITFTETIVDEETDDLTEIAADAIDAALGDFNEAAVADFAAALVTDDITTQMQIVSALNTQTQSMIDNLQPIATADKKKAANWLTASKEIKNAINNLYNKGLGYVKKGEGYVNAVLGYAEIAETIYNRALDIGRLSLYIMQLPANISISISEKIKGYSNLTANLINQYKNDPFGIEKMKTAYATAALAITGACASIASGSALTIAETAAMTGATPSASVAASVNAAAPAANIRAGTASREEAVEVANQVLSFLETTTDFQDEKIENLNAENKEINAAFVDAAPVAHLALIELVHMSAQLILNASFALPMQKTITLDRDRQVVELCAELYGTTDFLDDFIIQNNFNIDEIELLPMGKKVSYYVKST